MIIVSQDRKKIINFERIKSIWISNDTEEYFEINADGELLGNYKTEERAEKILEYIIKTYLSYASVKNLTGDIKSIHTIPSAYVMPKE